MRSGLYIRPENMIGRSMVVPNWSSTVGKPVLASGQHGSANPNTTGNSVSASTSGRARILSQSKPGWLGSTVTVPGSV